MNISKGGIGLSLGVRGASVSLGKKGTYANLGIPGTGLSVRNKLGGASQVTRSGYSSQRRGGMTKAEMKQAMNDNLAQEVEEMNRRNEQRINQHKAILRLPLGQTIREIFSPLSPPLYDPPKFMSDFAYTACIAICCLFPPLLLWPYFAKRGHIKRLDQYNHQYQSEKENVSARNKERAILVEALERGESNEIEQIFSDMFEKLDDMLGADIEIEMTEDATTARFLITLPDEECIPQTTYVLRKTTSDIIEKPRPRKQLLSDYKTYAHGVLLRIASTCFCFAPTISRVVCVGTVFRRNKSTSSLDEECILAVDIFRSIWENIEFQYIDPISVYDNFHVARDIRKGERMHKVELTKEFLWDNWGLAIPETSPSHDIFR